MWELGRSICRTQEEVSGVIIKEEHQIIIWLCKVLSNRCNKREPVICNCSKRWYRNSSYSSKNKRSTWKTTNSLPSSMVLKPKELRRDITERQDHLVMRIYNSTLKHRVTLFKTNTNKLYSINLSSQINNKWELTQLIRRCKCRTITWRICRSQVIRVLDKIKSISSRFHRRKLTRIRKVHTIVRNLMNYKTTLWQMKVWTFLKWTSAFWHSLMSLSNR